MSDLAKNEDGTVNVDGLSDATIEAMRNAAAGHGNEQAVDAYDRLLTRRASPDLYRHSRRRDR